MCRTTCLTELGAPTTVDCYGAPLTFCGGPADYMAVLGCSAMYKCVLLLACLLACLLDFVVRDKDSLCVREEKQILCCVEVCNCALASSIDLCSRLSAPSPCSLLAALLMTAQCQCRWVVRECAAPMYRGRRHKFATVCICKLVGSLANFLRYLRVL
jgi:hypothetical protein